MKDLILVGIQGSGKGTQAKILVKKMGFQILETGKFFRSLRDNNSDLAKRVIATIDKGEYVDDDTVMEIVREMLTEMDLSKPILFDGVPRSELQRIALEKILAEHKRDFQIISINITEEEAFDRLTKRSQMEGRRDDTPEGIKSRIKLFHELTQPMIKAWKNAGRVTEISGVGSIDEIAESISTILKEKGRCKNCTCGK